MPSDRDALHPRDTDPCAPVGSGEGPPPEGDGGDTDGKRSWRKKR